MTRYVLVPGTHATLRDNHDDQWWQPGSAFTTFLGSFDLYPARSRPFIWSSNLDGVRLWPWRWFSKDNHVDWKAAAHHLIDHLYYVPICDRNLIAHSHGLQVVLYAASFGLPISTLVSVMSPVRGDMKKVAAAARPNITNWWHLHSDWSDKMQVLGGLFDRQWGVQRKHPLADIDRSVPGVGHSSILKPEHMTMWSSLGIIDFLKGAPCPSGSKQFSTTPLRW